MSLVGQVGYFGLLLVVLGLGVWLERHTGSAQVYRTLPEWAKFLTAGIAFGGPWIPYWEGLYPALPPDPLLWVIALNGALWIGMPLALQSVVGTDRPEPTC